MQINISRLMEDIDKYAKYGFSEEGGVTRPSFSREDYEIRQLFIQELGEMGLSITVDGAANIWGEIKGTGKKDGSIVIGSHLDSVPNGGKFDGPLGTLVAKEIIKTLLEKQVMLDHDLEIVSFTAEESNDFNLSTFGSRAFAGKLTAKELEHVIDKNGRLLKAELKKVGGNLEGFSSMNVLKKNKKAFIELHIEQGKRLESENLAVGIINRVAGIYRSKVRVFGESNHSGTTLMEHRKDALTTASEMLLYVEKICQRERTDLVGTVGQLNVFPNATNIIAGQVEFTLEIRCGSVNRMEKVIQTIHSKWQEITERRGVVFEENIFLYQEPIDLDSKLVSILQESAEEMDEPYLTFTSMAIHDAAHMSAVTPAVMIFVKSIDGKSHCPEEYSTPEDIERAANLMLNGILHIDLKLE